MEGQLLQYILSLENLPKMKKGIILIASLFILQSCIVSTAASVVKGAAKLAYKTVKATVNGISWVVKKAEGKINEDRLDGTWKVVGVYHGSFDDFQKDSNPTVIFQTECSEGFDQLEFKTKKSKFKPAHCSSEDQDWMKYKLKFGKNPLTREKENYLEYGNNSYISVIDVSNKTMVLEGNVLPKLYFSGAKLFMLEKVK